MVDLTIRDGGMRFCGQMIRHLRREHHEAFAGVGLNAHRELRNTVAQSAYRRAAFLDGRLAAMWGVTGTVMCSTGLVWLALTNEAAARPILVLREARRQLDEIMRTKTELATTVLRDDEAALRLCVYMGFHVEDNGPGAPAHSKYGRRTLMELVRTNPELRKPVGNSYLVPMGYHVQQAEMR